MITPIDSYFNGFGDRENDVDFDSFNSNEILDFDLDGFSLYELGTLDFAPED